MAMKIAFGMFLVVLLVLYLWVRDGCKNPFKKKDGGNNE